MIDTRFNSFRKNAGFSMIEVLITMIILLVGLLSIGALQARAQIAEMESYQRAQALILMSDIIDRININRATLNCFRFTTNTANGTPYVGTGSTVTPACAASTANDNTRANEAIAEWDDLLQGVAETKGGSSVGAMVGARGCVSYDPATELIDSVTAAAIPDTGVYLVAISWQGTNDTFAPTVNCGNTLYGAETRRRVVSTTFRLARLN